MRMRARAKLLHLWRLHFTRTSCAPPSLSPCHSPRTPRPASARAQRDAQRTKMAVKHSISISSSSSSSSSSALGVMRWSRRHLAAKLQVLVAAARLQDAAAADDEGERRAAGSSSAGGDRVDEAGFAHIAAVAKAQLSEAVAAHGPDAAAVLEQETVRQAASDGGDGDVRGQRAEDVRGGVGGCVGV